MTAARGSSASRATRGPFIRAAEARSSSRPPTRRPARRFGAPPPATRCSAAWPRPATCWSATATTAICSGFDAATGAQLWRFRLPDMTLSSPLVTPGAIFTGGDDGSVYALDTNSAPAPAFDRYVYSYTDQPEAGLLLAQARPDRDDPRRPRRGRLRQDRQCRARAGSRQPGRTAGPQDHHAGRHAPAGRRRWSDAPPLSSMAAESWS